MNAVIFISGQSCRKNVLPVTTKRAFTRLNASNIKIMTNDMYPRKVHKTITANKIMDIRFPL